jgi:hypothetical protein
MSDFSNSETNLLASSGWSGGTRIGPPGPGGGLLVPDSGTLAVVSTTIPSKRGRGPAMKRMRDQHESHFSIGNTTHIAEPAHRRVHGQLGHVQLIAEQYRSQTGSGDPCSLYPQFAISTPPIISHGSHCCDPTPMISTYQAESIGG